MTSLPPGKIRTLIYGSCVSRDTFSHLDQNRYELTRYIARQSLVSAFSAPSVLEDGSLHNLKSNFQRRTLAGDFSSSLREHLVTHGSNTDLILWDLTDERFGIYERQREQFVTRSLELVSSGLDAELSSNHPLIKYGSTIHRDLWTAAASNFAILLADYAPNAKLLLLAPPWARFDTTGKGTRSPISRTVRSANRMLRQYIRIAETKLEPRLIGCPSPVADAIHPWGPAPYHYDTSVYQQMVRSIDQATDAMSSFPNRR